MSEYEPVWDRKPTDYTGLIIAAMFSPVFVVFACLGKPDMGLAAFIVLGMMALAIKLREALHKHVWF